MATCHPDRRHLGKGLCKQCYDSTYQTNNLPAHNAASKRYISRNPESRSATKRKYLYGISQEEYNRMYDEQHGLCAICGVGPAEHLDHDHVTTENRGLLCGNCNRGLGLFKDNPSFLLAAVVYLSAGKVN